jgi:hypothetical protein
MKYSDCQELTTHPTYLLWAGKPNPPHHNLCIWESSSCFRGSSSVQYTAQKVRNSQPKECLTGTTDAPAGSEQWIKSPGKVCKLREVTQRVSAQRRQFICLIQSECVLCVALTVVSLLLNMCGNCFYKNITLKKIWNAVLYNNLTIWNTSVRLCKYSNHRAAIYEAEGAHIFQISFTVMSFNFSAPASFQ